MSITPELIEKVLLSVSAVSGASWKVIDIFKPLFNKITAEDWRGMAKSLAAGVVGWAAAWAFGVQALNAIGYTVHPALDSIIVGLLSAGGAAVINVLYDLLKVLKDFVVARTAILPPIDNNNK